MVDPYSRVDLTSAIYAVLRHWRGQRFKFLLTNPKVELAFLAVFSMWLVHLRSFEIRRPRYGFVSTCFRIVPSNW